MKNLVINSEVISIRDAIKRVSRNIEALQVKLAGVSKGSYAFESIEKFYKEKIELQTITLEWLKKATENKIQG